MPETRSFNVLVTAEYEVSANDSFRAAGQVSDALLAGDPPWPVTVKIEVSENA